MIKAARQEKGSVIEKYVKKITKLKSDKKCQNSCANFTVIVKFCKKK